MISFKKNDVIIVTGASSGLGQSTAIQLNELGATVIAIARNKERLNETKLKCKYPDNFHIEVKDLTEKIEELPVYIKELKNKYGKFTGLAYCAGVANIAPLQAIDLTKAKEIFDINKITKINNTNRLFLMRISNNFSASAVSPYLAATKNS